MHTSPFKSSAVTVVGDVMLDRYYYGDVDRISPEAPVPVVRVRKETWALGGAANVAHNVCGLGAGATLIGMVGSDGKGRRLEQLSRKRTIVTRLVRHKGPTTTKSRVIGAHQQMLRLDFEEPGTVDRQAMKELRREIVAGLRGSQAVVISDYGKGLCGAELCRFIIRQAEKRAIPVVVDPKSEEWGKYEGAAFVTPNLKELRLAVGRTVPNEDAAVAEAARKLLKRYAIGHVLVTRSERGMSLVSARRTVHIHSRARDVFDVSGAGDTVVAAFAVGMGAGYDVRRSMELANAAAGQVVARVGTVPVTWEELVDEI